MENEQQKQKLPKNNTHLKMKCDDWSDWNPVKIKQYLIKKSDSCKKETKNANRAANQKVNQNPTSK